ncbi:MAG: helix-turn-helix domain-containing protein [Desulfovibrio sp.]|nr:helix-turn-helix domain-containing protein [Desulfovibrio sp.]
MSIDATTWAWKQRGLTPAQKLLLLSLADRAEEDHTCWPSLRRLAADTGLTDRGIQKILAELETRGLIRRDMRAGKSTVYTLIGVTSREDMPRSATPEPSSPPNPVHPRTQFAPNTVHPPPNPVRDSPPYPPCNVNPKEEPTKNRECARTPAPSSLPQKDACAQDATDAATPQVPKSGRKRKLEPKQPYGEFGNVLLTEAEHARLVQDYGQEETKAAIEKLDLHLGARKGAAPYKSHYLALRKWVFTALAEDRRRMGLPAFKKPQDGGMDGMDFFARMEAIERERNREAGHGQSGL